MTERSFVMVKPDGVARGLTGEIISRIERRGFRIVALRKALGPEAERLRTIRGVGYQLDADGDAQPPVVVQDRTPDLASAASAASAASRATVRIVPSTGLITPR